MSRFHRPPQFDSKLLGPNKDITASNSNFKSPQLRFKTSTTGTQERSFNFGRPSNTNFSRDPIPFQQTQLNQKQNLQQRARPTMTDINQKKFQIYSEKKASLQREIADIDEELEKYNNNLPFNDFKRN